MNSADTIFALSSGLLPSGVAVIRISGARARFAGETIVGSLPAPRNASLRTIRNRNGEVLDEGLVLFFPAPKSFTGEDCLELQVHGSRAVVSAVLTELSSYPGLRPAEPGEFTRRAFENGRLDLTEVEGLSDLIAAQTEFQRRLALEASQGRLRQLYDGWASRLTRARAWIEAEFDFADEDDVPGSMQDRIWPDLLALQGEIARHLEGAATGERIRNGFNVVLVGTVNAGKSSLLNALARRDAAIVSPVPGTTRDAISVNLDIGGYPVTLTDTAGLRETDDPVELEGIRRAEQARSAADLVLHLVAQGIELPTVATAQSDDVIVVASKSDLSTTHHASAISVSAKTGEGLEGLLQAIQDKLKTRFPVASLALPSRERQTGYLRSALSWLRQAVASDEPLELRAELLRAAQEDLGRITGQIRPDDLLDHIFAEFCIGK